jgi:hypothetical protein
MISHAWKSLNLRNLVVCVSSRFASTTAESRALLSVRFFDFVAQVCKRIARFTLPTNYYYLGHKIFNTDVSQLLPPMNGVGLHCEVFT